MLKRIRYFLIIALLCYSAPGWAILHLVLTQGVNSAVPIAVVPFSQEHTTGLTNMSSVITADLQNSGRFKNRLSSDAAQQVHQAQNVQLAYWQKQQVNYVIVGSVKNTGDDHYSVQFSLLDVYKQQKQGANPELANKLPILLSQTFNVTGEQLRQLAHHISDLIYQSILGIRGVFSTKIAYVLLQRPAKQAPLYQLMVADYDGANPQPILKSHQPIMSPAWSPDGQQLAYVSFENGQPAIYISNVTTGKRRLITNFPGINGAPAFSPDGNRLAVVLSKGRQPNIYIINLTNAKMQQITHSYAIDTEPSWAENGESLLFTSDRGGTPQIYQADLSSHQIKRITFDGNYNAHAGFDPAGQNIVLLHRGLDSNNQFSVALQDISTGTLQVLANDNVQSPSIAPNGSMVIYATQNQQGHGELAMVSTDGRVQLKLPSGNGDVREPAWSPFNEGS